MVDVSQIGAALAALKAAKDIAQAMIGLRDTAAFQTKLMEFQSKIIDANNAVFAAQEERTTFLETISDLEKKVASLEAWEAEKQRYNLADIGNGVLAYVLESEAGGSEPPHHLCANCFTKKHKSILQPETVMPGVWRVEVCHNCSAVYWPHGGQRQTSPKPKKR